MTVNFFLEIQPHDCHSCYWFAIQPTLEIKSAYSGDLNQEPHPSEPCVLTIRLTHAILAHKARKGEVPGSSHHYRWIFLLLVFAA